MTAAGASRDGAAPGPEGRPAPGCGPAASRGAAAAEGAEPCGAGPSAKETPPGRGGRPPRRSPFPPWLRKRVPSRGEAERVRALLAELSLETVCSSAHCPNLPECFARGTATFMILGRSCTRSCRFCAVPDGPPGPPRDEEPEAVAEAEGAEDGQG